MAGRWLRFVRRRFWDEERARELASYLAEEIADNLARGLSPEEARREAHRKLGNVTRIREEIYEMNSLGFLESLGQDLRYGVRLLRRNPTFAIVAIVTLALGTGANSAMFQLVDAIQLRALPVERPDELVEVRIVKTRGGRTGNFMGSRPSLSYPLWERIRAEQRVFSGMLAWGTVSWNLTTGGEVRLAQGMYVSGDYFPTLGVRAAVGRVLSPDDDVRGCAAPGAVLGYAFWRREYGGDPSAVGRTIVLDGHRLDIVGVAQASFFGTEVGRAFDVAVPLCAEPAFRGARSGIDRADVWYLAAFGRLRRGVTLDQASAQLNAISSGIFHSLVPSRYRPQDAADYVEFKLGAIPAATGFSTLRAAYDNPVKILLGVTALVLLIACANLANLMLARATAREREVAVRLAIGASRRRIVRQMLSESLLLAAAGAGAGLLVARWFSAFLVSFLSTDGTRLFLDLAPNWRVFAFTAMVAVAACLVFGLAPAVRATRTPPAATMKTGSRGLTDGRERFGLRRALVSLQVALSLVLVVAAMLFVRSLLNLTHVDAGFRADGLLVANVDYRKAGIQPALVPAITARVLEALRTLNGVDAVAQVFTTPIGGNFWNNSVVLGGVDQPGMVNFNSVGPGYFKAMATPIVRGRDFDEHDTPQSQKVAIVSEAFARTYFAGRDAIGQVFQIAGPVGDPRPMLQVIGVARDTKYGDLREEFGPIAYVAATQDAEPNMFPNFVLHATGPLAPVSAGVTRALAQVNPAITVQYQTVETQIAGSLLRDRLMATLSSLFGGLALLIASVGLYGVMSYMVARRRMEIGIRLALGADRGSVMRLVVRESGLLVLGGIAAGIALAGVAGRAARTLLYELKPWDPTAMALAVGALIAVSLVASAVPAYRAACVNPTAALREE